MSASSGTSFNVDFGAITEAAGAMMGVDAVVGSDPYLETLIQKAHYEAAEEFDAAVVASAGSGYLTHVFEYGTAGVTRGPIRFPNPMDDSARLWINHLSGHGANQNIFYTFRPAINRNPQPTTAYTGVPSKYLRKLSRRKYVFRQKAAVMESGIEVDIKPKNGNLLFVPFYGEANEYNPLDRRGFLMYPFGKDKPIKAVPGRDTRGTFTRFWTTWWNSRGVEAISASAEKDVMSDVESVITGASARAKGTSMKPAGYDLKAQAVSSKKEAETALRRKAATRRRK